MEAAVTMPGANSVTSNQETIHKDLEKVVRKYARTTFLRPIADHTREAFAEVENFVREFYRAARNGDPSQIETIKCMDPPSEDDSAENIAKQAPRTVILDSGCGTGESTIHIARRFPSNPVIGIDKSGMRLTKAGNPAQTAGEDVPRNAFWIRAELLDFWRLALERVQAGEWTIPYHAVYYPNPWPKQSEATRRFHMHPIFPTLLALGDTIELRTNWEIYAREFAEAARIVLSVNAENTDNNGTVITAPANAHITCEAFDPVSPETAFERKYKEARQTLWRVVIG